MGYLVGEGELEFGGGGRHPEDDRGGGGVIGCPVVHLPAVGDREAGEATGVGDQVIPYRIETFLYQCAQVGRDVVAQSEALAATSRHEHEGAEEYEESSTHRAILAGAKAASAHRELDPARIGVDCSQVPRHEDLESASRRTRCFAHSSADRNFSLVARR